MTSRHGAFSPSSSRSSPQAAPSRFSAPCFTSAAWATCLVIIGVATGGKLGGTVGAARVIGMSWRESVMLGALMNTRGLMELIVLNIRYDLGILSSEIFTMLVLMALATTALTGPMLSLATLAWPASRDVPPPCEPMPDEFGAQPTRDAAGA